MKALSPEGFAPASAASAASRNAAAFALAPASACSAACARHGFAATPPRASRALRIDAAVEVERGGGGHEREGEGRALAKLEIARMRRKARRFARKTKRDDQVPRLERAFALRRVAGQAVKVLERNLAPTPSAFDLDNRVERDERHAEVRRMGRDAALAPADDRVQAVLAVERVAARARLTPVAGARHVIEIAAARPLHQVAADGRGVAELRRGAGEQRFGDGRIGAGEVRVMREVGVAHERADAHAAVGQPLDAVEARQARDVDETVGPHRAALHQVEQIGAGGEIGRARLRRRGDRFRNRGGSHIVEDLHAAVLRSRSASRFCASSTASVMPR